VPPLLLKKARFMTRLAAILLSLVLSVPAAFADQDADFETAVRLVEQGQHELAASRMRALAQQGHAGAQFNLGFLYDMGWGVERDVYAAFNWYSLAASQELPDAEFNVGAMYFIGRGVDKDIDRAIIWFRRAAERGLAEAQTNLAVAYETGDGVEQDHEEAAEWYRKAAEQGSEKAQFNLGYLYVKGLGVDRDLVDAYKWFTLAAIQGHEQATQNRALVVRAMTKEQARLGDSNVRAFLETHPEFANKFRQ
jgi:TPR repeat protein